MNYRLSRFAQSNIHFITQKKKSKLNIYICTVGILAKPTNSKNVPKWWKITI